MATDEMMLVRIKPYNPRIGCVVRRYMIQGTHFKEDNGWYKVPASLADVLKVKPQRDSAPFGQMIFDVCTQAEAEALEHEAELRKQRAAAVRPHDIRTTVVDGVPVRRSRPRVDDGPTNVLTTKDLPKFDAPAPQEPLDLADGEDDDLDGEGEDAEPSYVAPAQAQSLIPGRRSPPKRGRPKS